MLSPTASTIKKYQLTVLYSPKLNKGTIEIEVATSRRARIHIAFNVKGTLILRGSTNQYSPVSFCAFELIPGFDQFLIAISIVVCIRQCRKKWYGFWVRSARGVLDPNFVHCPMDLNSTVR